MISRRNPFAKKKRWILDGGLATELEKRGFNLNHPLWSAKVLAEDAKAIYEVHKSYLAAGADIILTASYQASVDGFVQHLDMYEREAQEVLFFTVEIACRARDDYARELGLDREILIGASVGPYGAILADGSEYGGGYDVSNSKVGDYYADKVERLILPRRNVRADFLAFETVPTRKEAELIMIILKTIPWASAWISFSNPEALVETLPQLEQNEQIQALGLNCVEPGVINSFLPELRKKTAKPIVIYPNGGGSYDSGKKQWKWNDPTADVNQWKVFGRQWLEAGANILGGCCGTGPDHIRSLSTQALSLK